MGGASTRMYFECKQESVYTQGNWSWQGGGGGGGVGGRAGSEQSVSSPSIIHHEVKAGLPRWYPNSSRPPPTHLTPTPHFLSLRPQTICGEKPLSFVWRIYPERQQNPSSMVTNVMIHIHNSLILTQIWTEQTAFEVDLNALSHIRCVITNCNPKLYSARV